MLLPSYRYFLFIVYFLVIHFQLLGGIIVLLIGTSNERVQLLANTVIAIFHLLYPFCGWIAEVRVSNYKVIQCSLILLTLASAVIIVLPLGGLLVDDNDNIDYWYTAVITTAAVFLYNSRFEFI